MKSKFKLKLTVALGILFFASMTPLLWADPKLTIKSPPELISLEKNIEFEIYLEWPASKDTYEITAPEPQLVNLSLLKQGQSQETGSMLRNTITYELRPLNKGEAIIRSFEIRFRRPGTETWETLLVPEQKMTIITVFPWKRYLAEAGILLSLILTIGTGIIFFRQLKKKARLKNKPAVDPRQRVYTDAEESIAKTVAAPREDILRIWSTQLRSVVAAYYGISLSNASETEILSILRTKKLSKGEWNEISGLFDQMSRLKFSHQQTTVDDLDRMQNSLLQYVRGKIIIENS